MGTIKIETIINAPMQSVFDSLSDHGAYGDFKAIDHAEVVKEGLESKNGNGAIRKIISGPITFWEEISNYTEPSRFDYKIINGQVNISFLKLPFPFEHRLGRITLEESAEGTKVIWLSEIDSTLPLIGSFLTKLFVQKGTKGFSSILKQVKRRLEQ